MMMMFDRKKSVTQILGDEKKQGAAERPSHVIVSELIECIHSHDIDGSLNCLRALFLELGSAHYSAGSEEGG